MLGPITQERMELSKKAFKQGDQPVLVQLSNNAVFNINKPKMVKDLVGQLAEATGELKVNDGQIKLQGVKPIEAASIPAGDPARKLLDVRTYKVKDGPALHEKIRHELAMMPYITEFDFISFALNESEVVLTGWTVRITNRSEAQNRIITSKASPASSTTLKSCRCAASTCRFAPARARISSASCPATSGAMAPTSRSSSRTE
jgi:hypothetical protein